MIDIRQHTFLIDTKEKQVDITCECGWGNTIYKDKPSHVDAWIQKSMGGHLWDYYNYHNKLEGRQNVTSK